MLFPSLADVKEEMEAPMAFRERERGRESGGGGGARALGLQISSSSPPSSSATHCEQKTRAHSPGMACTRAMAALFAVRLLCSARQLFRVRSKPNLDLINISIDPRFKSKFNQLQRYGRDLDSKQYFFLTGGEII